jgi:hypothetical protein
VVLSLASSHLSAFLRSNYEQALALPLCLVFGFIAASQGQWWSDFIFAFSFVYAGILLRAWRKSRVEAAPSRAALVNRRDVQRILHDPELLTKAQEPPLNHEVHAGIILHGGDDLSFVKFDSSRLKINANWAAVVDPDTPETMSFSTLPEALSWCSRHEIVWLTGTRAQDRVLHELFAAVD